MIKVHQQWGFMGGWVGGGGGLGYGSVVVFFLY